jgi:hypothetical protein
MTCSRTFATEKAMTAVVCRKSRKLSQQTEQKKMKIVS